jgi:hypothetical protein
MLAPVANAGDPALRCTAAKLRAAGQKVQGKLGCHARGLLDGGGADAGCLAKVEAKFLARWGRIEGKGGCPVVGDAAAVEDRVDAFVADLVDALPPGTSTSTTTTTTSSCPPTTAFYCGNFCPGPGPPPLCPSGKTCVVGETGCSCVGDPIPCGNLIGAGNFCRWGECPPGLTCAADPGSTSCPPACSCQ